MRADKMRRGLEEEEYEGVGVVVAAPPSGALNERP
jgi:hypothetical protein